jgi:hypothetical protein
MRGCFLFIALTLLSAAGFAQWRSITRLPRQREPKSIRSCPDEFKMHKEGKTFALRYVSNFSLNKKDTSVRTMLVFIHGLHRNAMGYFDDAVEAVRSAGQKKTTLVVAPQYATQEDMSEFHLGGDFLYWNKAQWKDGYSAVTTNSRTPELSMSSYEVMDSLIANILGSGNFPNIRRVVIAGHSAGGQFVDRYSVTTPIPELWTSVSFRFIVMNPSSYLYPDAKRPTSDGSFVVPDSTVCPEYNHYPKGLTGLNAYAEAAGADRILANMLHRDIFLLLGGDDTDIDDPDLDTSCAGNMQGPFRLARGISFMGYISNFPGYGDKKNLAIVRGVGHSGTLIESDEAIRWIFGQ